MMYQPDKQIRPDTALFDLPHVLSAEFLGDFLMGLQEDEGNSTQSKIHDNLHLDADFESGRILDPEDAEDMESETYRFLGPFHEHIDWFLREGTDPRIPWDEDAAEERDLFLRARNAVFSNDRDECLATIETILGMKMALGLNPHWNSGLVENWAMLLPTEVAEENTESVTLDAITAAMNDLCDQLCKIVAKDPKALMQIEWRQLEQIIAHALDGLGFAVELTPPSKDGGKDIVATCFLRGKKRIYYIEVKHWRSMKRVSSGPVLEFIEVNLSEQTSGGLFLSSSGFQDSIVGQVGELSRQKIHLGGKNKIVSLCQRFTRRKMGLWESAALPDVLFERTLEN